MTCDCDSPSRRRPRGVSLIVFSVLVFVALGSSAFAAGSLARNSVGSVQIKSGAVQGSELHADAVTSGKIKNGTIAGSDVATGTLGGREVADGSLTGADLTDGSLTGADLTDGSVTGGDLADGSVIGDDLADASVGGRKLAGNSIGIQAIEPLTQKSLIDVPTTQVLPTRPSDVTLNLNPQNVLQWVSPEAHAGLNVVQAQVSVRVSKTISVTCEIVVDGTVATRVHETITHTGDLLADYTTVPLMTTASLKADSTVATRCTAGQNSFATALLTSTVENYSLNATSMIVTRMTR